MKTKSFNIIAILVIVCFFFNSFPASAKDYTQSSGSGHKTYSFSEQSRSAFEEDEIVEPDPVWVAPAGEEMEGDNYLDLISPELNPEEFNKGIEKKTILTKTGFELKEDGNWYLNSDRYPKEATNEGISVQAINGPDQFGYTWEDDYPYNWVDASLGTDTGINNQVTFAGPVPIGFNFKYYTNSYTALYISRNGYVSFNNTNLEVSQSYIPNTRLPNDVIAPLWGPTDSINYVRYLNDGSSPNRRFIIEWNNKVDDEGTENYTFQMILHENGDLIFQYKEIVIEGVYAAISSGIENEDGTDGLTIEDLGEYGIDSGEAARIYRPAPSARLKMTPERQGGFVTPLSTLEYFLTISNTGDYGADTYDIVVETVWAVSIFKSDGISPLTDTDGDGIIDTGSINEGNGVGILARIVQPVGVAVGDANDTSITATSSLNSSISKKSKISLAIPSAFTQAFYGDSGGGVYLVHPNLQIENFPNWWTPSLGVIETVNGNIVYADQRQSYDPGFDTYITKMQVTAFNSYGQIITPAHPLSTILPSEHMIWELDPALAAAPNGNVGVLWYSEEYAEASSDTRLYNMHFAIIDEMGNLVYGPINITSNTIFGTYYDNNVPIYSDPQIAVTEDGKFAISFTQYIRENDLPYYDTIFSIRNPDGSEIKPITNLTRGVSNDSYNSSLTTINGNEYFLIWESEDSYETYMVINSSGNVIQPPTNIGLDFWGMDVTQLSDGRIFIAGQKYYEGSGAEIHFIILDGVSRDPITPIVPLLNPHSNGDNYSLSVTKDSNNHAILTWEDGNLKNYYYALVGNDGAIITQPFIYRTYVTIAATLGENGYSNSTYSAEINPFTSCDDVTLIPVAECNALQSLYDATNGDNWTNNDGWFGLNNPGGWYGVTTSEGHVVELALSNNNLIGTIPTSIGNLSHLTNLYLSNNQLDGTIPTEFGSLSNLINLGLNNNLLDGSIPPELGNLVNLETLYLWTNQLSGAIPSQLGGLANLLYLNLSENQLSGSIPITIGNLSKLRTLNLQLNPLGGSIPPDLGKLQDLSQLWLQGNQLTGNIPVELGNLSNLTYLVLFNNQLTGSIPVELSNLASLRYLILGRNEFSGSISPELGNLVNLRELNLSANQLAGSIPSEIGNLTNLTSLVVDNNNLSGNIPVSLGNLKNITRLMLSYNDLTGSLPSELGGLSLLKWLSLNDNNLTDSVPLTFINLTSMVYLNFTNTYICEPTTPEFLGWKSTVADYRGTGFSCMSAFPKNGEKLTSSKVTFNWDPVPDAIKYKIQLSTKEDFSSTVFSVNTTTNTYPYLTSLISGKTYYWRIRALVGVSWTNWITFQFYSMDPLAASLLESPPNGSVLSLPVTLSWNPVVNAVQYQLQVARDSAFTDQVFKGKVSNTFKDFSDLAPGKYYWRVKAIEAGGLKGPWSDVRLFTVVKVFPPALVSPGNEATVNLDVTLTWEAPEFATQYKLQVSKDAAFTRLIVDEKTAGLSKALTGLAARNYYWRVRAFTADGFKSPWSEVRKFTVVP